eukprot:m.38214 g.38214  ORF g.38214 m.38214 type:complete len:496 (-) comp11160_c0_seq1:99-1586(-)
MTDFLSVLFAWLAGLAYWVLQATVRRGRRSTQEPLERAMCRVVLGEQSHTAFFLKVKEETIVCVCFHDPPPQNADEFLITIYTLNGGLDSNSRFPAAGYWKEDVRSIYDDCHVLFLTFDGKQLEQYRSPVVPLELKQLEAPALEQLVQPGDGFISRSCFGGRRKGTGQGLVFSAHMGSVCAVRNQNFPLLAPAIRVASYLVEGVVLQGSCGSPLCTRDGTVFAVVTHHVALQGQLEQGTDELTNLASALSLHTLVALLEADDPVATFEAMGKRFTGCHTSTTCWEFGKKNKSKNKETDKETTPLLQQRLINDLRPNIAVEQRRTLTSDTSTQFEHYYWNLDENFDIKLLAEDFFAANSKRKEHYRKSHVQHVNRDYKCHGVMIAQVHRQDGTWFFVEGQAFTTDEQGNTLHMKQPNNGLHPEFHLLAFLLSAMKQDVDRTKLHPVLINFQIWVSLQKDACDSCQQKFSEFLEIVQRQYKAFVNQTAGGFSVKISR